MAKRYKKALVKSEKECNRLRAGKKQLKRELLMEMESTKHDIRLIKEQSERIKFLTMERNGKQSLMMCSLEVLNDCQREVETYKFATATAACISITLGILLTISLLG